MKNTFLLAGLTIVTGLSRAQNYDPAHVYLGLQKLNTLGSVLYIAAHPDDENTSLISYLSKGRHMRTAYLSLTRGDGGQNLVGSEQNEELGLIRTRELLAAREIDGGEQYFTRAVDFGYSRTAEETLQFWGQEEILSDIVWVIRKFRPDVIITRFPPASYEYQTHGHHRASAILAEEAFNAAGDPKRFPEQLQQLSVWQAKRLYWNTSRWFYRRTGQELDPEGMIMMDVGEYDPLLGKSYAALAASGRSMHKSQGFGASAYLGSLPAYLEYVAGQQAVADLFDDIETSWSRVNGGETVAQHVANSLEEFDFGNPAGVLQHLLNALQAVNDLSTDSWTEVKRLELHSLILAVAGIHVEVNASDYYATPGADVDFTVSLVNGSGMSVAVRIGEDSDSAFYLEHNQLLELKRSLEIPSNEPITRPYWLRTPRSTYGRFELSDLDVTLLGNAWNEPAKSVLVSFEFDGKAVPITVPITYKWTDRVKGEQVRPFVIMPAVTAKFDQDFYIFPDSAWKAVYVTLNGWAEQSAGEVSLAGAVGWKATPGSQQFSLAKGEETTLTFRVGPKDWSVDILSVLIDRQLAYATVEIDYDHIPRIVWLPNTGAIVSSAEIKTVGEQIGYIMGAGDAVPNAMQQMGYQVTMITEDNFDQLDLSQLDAIVAGVRAYNTETWLPSRHRKLMQYVAEGGNYVVQYATTWGQLTDEIGPYPFEIGRGRVTEEMAPMGTPDRNHSILSYPNKITPFDFNGWVQERGLYFAESWDAHYDTIFVMSDTDRELESGSLLATRYGKGTFVYTGISFFRQLPVGVPGSYRLWANILAYGKQRKE